MRQQQTADKQQIPIVTVEGTELHTHHADGILPLRLLFPGQRRGPRPTGRGLPPPEGQPLSRPDSCHATQDSRPRAARPCNFFQDEWEALFIPKVFQFVSVDRHCGQANMMCPQGFVDR